MQIAILGLGYVGAVSAACLAQLGHRVIGVDRDPHKVESIRGARSPFYEPGLDELVATNVAAGRLSATCSTAEALREAEIAFICVGTPSAKNGDISLEQLRRVVEDVVACDRHKPLIVAIRSTIFPGTCDDVILPAIREGGHIRVVANPEFMREGAAVRDFMEPSLVVIGGTDHGATETVASVYRPLGINPCLVSLRTAEMIKYACNAFHAVKVSFANEIGAMSDELGVDGLEVMETLCRDNRLNISAAYLRPGFAFGGSCLPKDLRALMHRAKHRDLRVPLLESTLASNDEHLRRGVASVLDSKAERIGVIGLAFKQNTDDVRESPVVHLLEQLVGKGRDVRVYDPHVELSDIYGSNRNFVLNAIPHIGRLMHALDDVLGWAQELVVAQNSSAELAARIRASGLPVIDLVRTMRGPTGACDG